MHQCLCLFINLCLSFQNLQIHFNRFCQINSLQDLKKHSSSLVCLCKPYTVYFISCIL
nr:hypothetical protein Iba_scaffold710428CG0010 [Ipomoea batatas]GMD62548.1 hypothetical protein Iba_chr12bCG6460 [Ipomoea batatas]GMD65220.1 hypothetical protein Iba_chr12cCG3290 [Ipomoea batatas]GMD71774.1 hypothetical protein Iba_chr12fCG2120 [Ipomoea batatas]GME16221.1 hypothetical protein Iba_scaffold17214CG0070 [Ipomoea batatas]